MAKAKVPPKHGTPRAATARILVNRLIRSQVELWDVVGELEGLLGCDLDDKAEVIGRHASVYDKPYNEIDAIEFLEELLEESV